MVIAAETDEAAMQKWQHYNDGADMEAICWLQDQGAKIKCLALTPIFATWPLAFLPSISIWAPLLALLKMSQKCSIKFPRLKGQREFC